MKTRDPIEPLHYEQAPADAPDKFYLTQDTVVLWKNVPNWVWKRIGGKAFSSPQGLLYTRIGEKGERTIFLNVYAGYYFSVSVAPNDPKAVPGSLPHDWIYQHAHGIAKALGVSVRWVLAFADCWFLLVMRYTGFKYRSVYFAGVRIFGYWFHAWFGKETA